METTNTLRVGDIRWTIQSSIESNNYEIYDKQEPYQVKITQDLGDLYRASYLRRDGSVDTDTNATCYGRSDQFYFTEKEANEAYLQTLYSKYEEVKDELENLAISIEVWERKVDVIDEP